MQRRKWYRKATKEKLSMKQCPVTARKEKTAVGPNKGWKTRLKSSLHNNGKKEEVTQGPWNTI